MSVSVLISWILCLLFDVFISKCPIGSKATRTFQILQTKFVSPKQSSLIFVAMYLNVLLCHKLRKLLSLLKGRCLCTSIYIDRRGAQILHEAVSVCEEAKAGLGGMHPLP